MESWQSGRQELLGVVAKIYDKIRGNVETELAQDQFVENERLIKENARLTEELRKYKSDSLAPLSQKPEGQNQTLTTTLQSAPGQNDAEIREVAHNNPKFDDTVLGLISTNSSLSSYRAGNSSSKSIPVATYNSLVTKYNLIFQNWTDIKVTRTQLEKSLRAEKDKAKRYNLFCDGLEKKLVRKRDKIRQLEEKLRSVEDKIHSRRQSGTTEVGHATKLRASGEGAEYVRRTFEPAAITETRQSEAVVNRAIVMFQSPTLNNANIPSHPIDLPANNILRDSNCKNDQVGPDEMSNGQVDPGIHSPLLDQPNDPESDGQSLGLIGERSGDVDAEELHYQSVNIQNTGSTEGNDGSNCPTIVGGHDYTIKAESQVDVQSLHDTPVVIQKRSVKKRKSRKNPTVPTMIKVETISSSPIGLAAFSGLEAHESIDLDDIGDKQITPRKQRSLRHKLSTPIPYGSRSLRNAQQETGSDSLLKVKRVEEQTPANRYGLQEDSAPLSSSSARQISPKISSSRAIKRRRITTDIAIEELAEDGENIGTVEISSSRRETPESSGRLVELLENPMQSGHAAILPDLSVLPIHREDGFRPPVSNGAFSLPRQPATPQDDSLKSLLLEILSTDHTPSSRPKPTDSSGAHKASIHANVQETLSSTPIGFPRETYEGLKRGFGTRQLSKDEDNQAANTRMSSATKTGTSRSREYGYDIDEDPENRPVRSRPLNKLSLGDFKINPNYNHGYDYAFTNVVRNQAERRCLPGCTKPECCGNAFRALAEAAWDPSRLPTASQEETDTRLLKEFLGDNAYKIRNMTKAEKDETLLQAKTRELANKHGKHRHAYERRRSPPGFWRVDFPSTQEEREDREKGERLERDLVAQRYNEAMRPGGAYIFRDE